MFLDAWFGLEYSQRDGSLCNWCSFRFPGDDEATAEACILHHLVPKKLGGRGNTDWMYILTVDSCKSAVIKERFDPGIEIIRFMYRA